MKWVDQHIEVVPPKKPKKISGTRLGAILGANPWSSQFQAWSQITKTYEPPFEDNKYTIAGKTIESKQIAYLKKSYFMTDIVTPVDIWGEDFFKKTWGDFYKNDPIYGGMFDCKRTEAKTIIECKTTKRVEDWKDDIPEYYALQAALYAYLEGYEDVLMICSVLKDSDYEDPDAYVPTSRNTFIKTFKVHERYPQFERTHILKAKEWWDAHVLTGISPDYDEKKDAEYLTALRTSHLAPETDIQALLKEASELKVYLDNQHSKLDEKEKRLKTITEQLKQYAINQFKEGDKKVDMTYGCYTWQVSKTTSYSMDKKAMEIDGVLDKYQKATDSYRITVKEVEENV